MQTQRKAGTLKNVTASQPECCMSRLVACTAAGFMWKFVYTPNGELPYQAQLPQMKR